MRIFRSLPAIIAALLISAVPLAAPAQFSLGIGVAIGAPPPALPYYSQPPAPYPNYQWNPGYWAWGTGGYYWVPGVWVAPPAVGLYWTPGYWGASGGGYGWNAGYWGASVGFYGGINYGYGYPGSGFYGGTWSGGAFRYNTAVVHVNRTVIHNTYNKTVVNKNVCNNCKNVSYNGGKGGVQAKPTSAQLQARRTGRPPTTQQRDTARIAGSDRNQLASVNKGKPSVVAADKPLSDSNKPKDFAPVTASDKQNAQKLVKNSNGGASAGNNGKVGGTNASGNKNAGNKNAGSNNAGNKNAGSNNAGNKNAGNKNAGGNKGSGNASGAGQPKHKQPPPSGGNAMQSQGSGHRQGGGGGKHNPGQPPSGGAMAQAGGHQGGGGANRQGGGGGGNRQGGGGGGKQGKPPSF